MVVICPKCRVKLNVDEAKIGAQGTKFKCPKCSTVLMVKKPAAQAKKSLASDKVLIAHSSPAMIDRIRALLSDQGYSVITASDGIDVMVKALKEIPFLTIIEVALPKIYGFEVCKRLKSREETKDMKFILLPSIHDKSKYRRDPVSLYGADEYIEEHELDSQLIDRINKIRGLKEEEKPEKKTEPVIKPPEPAQQQAPIEKVVNEEAITKQAAPPQEKGPDDERIEKARRLARTIINDIYLYNSAKLDESLRNNNFYSVFSAEIREGQKLYDARIPQEIRNIHNYYREAIENFLAAKKKILG